MSVYTQVKQKKVFEIKDYNEIDILKQAVFIRNSSIISTLESVRNKFRQHLTPPEVALLAVSMFDIRKSNISCLDLGGGTGILSAAIIKKFGNRISDIDNIELDEKLALIYETEIRKYAKGETILGDAITVTAFRNKKYDAVILNPPYKKMAANDYRQDMLPANSPNLYAAFIMIGIQYLADEGQLVAIIPRSWMNGDYFIQFRNYVLKECSLDFMHVYGSRNEVFSDTNVLQETMIIRLSKRNIQSPFIFVSQSDVKSEKAKIKKLLK